MAISNIKNLGFKSPQEKCLENPDILEEIMGYLDPKSLCALARVSKTINLVYKTLEDETLFPKSCEKRIQKIFIPFLFRYKTYQDLAIEAYLKSEEKPYLKILNSLLGRIQKYVLSFFKSESSEIRAVLPKAPFLHKSGILIVSKDFIAYAIRESYPACIKRITSFLNSLISAEKLFVFKVLLEAPQFNSDVLNDVCWKALQDNKALGTFNNYNMMIDSILINHNTPKLLNRFPQINPVVLRKMFIATRDDSSWMENSSWIKERHLRDLNREGVQKEWAKTLLLQARLENGEISRKAYTDILYSESHDTELENTRLIEELIKSHRFSEINPIVLKRVCVVAVLSMNNNSTRLLEELIKSSGNTRSKIYFLKDLLITLIQFKDDRIIDLLVGLNETNELITHCLNEALVWAAIDDDSRNVKAILDSSQAVSNDALGQSLDWAAKKGHSETIKILLNFPKITDINADFLEKALISATENGHNKSVELLASPKLISIAEMYP